MTSKPTKQHLDAFVGHIVTTLPDSIRARKTLLVVLHRLLPREASEQRQSVRMLIETLSLHEAEQLKFTGIIDGHNS